MAEEQANEETVETIDSLLTTDTKQVADKTEEQELEVSDSKADEEQKPNAPETYEAFTLPEDVAVDEKSIEAFLPLAKELNLTQEQAQKLVDFQVKTMQEGASTQSDNWDNVQKEWVSAVKSDAEIGGLAFEENIGIARKAMEAFGTPELTAVLDSTGAGNNPEVVRFMYRVGKAISEDTIHSGGAVAAPKSQAETLFPDMN
jgi:hypothetical protein